MDDLEDDLAEDLYSCSSDDEERKLDKRKRLALKKEKELKMIENGENLKETGRKKFKTDAVIVENDQDMNFMNKGQSKARLLLKSYNDNNCNDDQFIEDKKISLIDAKKEKANKKLNEGLLEGVDLQKIKKKYEKGQNQQFDMQDIEQFMDENDDDAYKLLDGGNIDYNVFDNSNKEDFERQKTQVIEDQIIEEPKPMAGWGDWAGPGITVKPQTAEQLHAIETKKRKQIEQIRAKRKDKNSDNVI